MAGIGRRRSWPVAVAIGMIAGLLLASCGAGPGAGNASDESVVRIEDNPGSLIAFIGYLAQKEGFFGQNHLNVRFVNLQQGVQATNALAGGSMDVGLLDLNNTAPLLVKGLQLQLVENETVNYWYLEVDKSLQGKTMSQVMQQTKTIGVPSIGGSGGRFYAALEQAYEIPASSVQEVVDTNGSGFLAGHEHAIMTAPEHTCVFEGQGAKPAFSFQTPVETVSSYPASLQPLVGLPDMGFWTLKKWSDSHKQSVSRLQAALSQTIAWVHNPQNLTKMENDLRHSPDNTSALSDAQWHSCVASNVNAFEDHFSEADAKVWGKVLQSTGVVPSALPPTSSWLAPGVPAK